jgi:phage baseplate assembly protein W
MAGFVFPFKVSAAGSITPERSDAADLRGKIIQVLFTSPGERINNPDFGCGLLNLVFEPNNSVLGAATEFTIGQALSRWLGDRLVVAGVDVSAEQESLVVEVSYIDRRDLSRQAVSVRFR